MEPQLPTISQQGFGQSDEQTVTVSLDDGRQLAYAEYGREDGVPVIFFHGTPGSRCLGSLFEQAALEHGIRLLAPDRPGYGLSSPWPNRSVTDAGRYVSAVLDHADVQTANFVAFSGGAPEALGTAATNPEVVERVDVVSGATPPTISKETPALQRFLATLATTLPTFAGGLFRGQAWLARHLNPDFVVSQYTGADTGGSVPDDIAMTVKQDFIEALSRHRTGAITDFRHMATEWDFEFGDIDTAVYLWHGEDDTNVPVGDVRRVDALMPTAQLRMLEDADHLTTLLESIPVVLEEYR